MEAIGHIEGLYWSGQDAQTVADFLRGNKTVADLTDKNLEWEKLKLKIEVGGRPVRKSDKTEIDTTDKEAYEWSTRKRSETVLSIIETNLRKFGIWGADEERRTIGIGALRSKSNFSEDELVGDQIFNLGYFPASEGGPHVIGKIGVPEAGATKRKTDERIRGSLAHEASHYIRALTNKNFWKGFEEEARSHGLRESEIIARQKAIGGFYVGSNLQGSESVGDLFTKTVELEAVGSAATIDNILIKLKVSIEENASGINDYSVSKVALYNHLRQLKDLGLGNVHGYDIVALCTFGYTSYEKLPSLIKLGIIDQEKFGEMKQVIRNVGAWLTEGSQNI